MPGYTAPRRDLSFVLFDLLDAESHWQAMAATREVDRALAEAIIDAGGTLAESAFLPLNASGDAEGCRFDGGEVTTPAGFIEAYRDYAEGGWTGLGGEPEHGGQGMPKMLTVAVEEMFFAANTSLYLYPALSAGAALLIASHGSEAMKQRWLPEIYAGTTTGTMCLTEPHAGSDLGLLRTRAEPLADGEYSLTGTKIFITGGEHDLTDNIVHLVLARLPDAPEGSRGISLFLVPKVLDDGQRNAVAAGAIEHKMGIRGSATCVLNFDGARGYLIGEPNRGLACMFTMMNYERLSIGLQGLGAGEIAYQNALAYARERLQGRAPRPDDRRE
ncbi:MAG: acyl-CoA dehydrogenase, partial [Gammaproteobacteria bacterium]|nr:acyl-CoA dehydrogenase [Gammaproteobacteria bacterium]